MGLSQNRNTIQNIDILKILDTIFCCEILFWDSPYIFGNMSRVLPEANALMYKEKKHIMRQNNQKSKK